MNLVLKTSISNNRFFQWTLTLLSMVSMALLIPQHAFGNPYANVEACTQETSAIGELCSGSAQELSIDALQAQYAGLGKFAGAVAGDSAIATMQDKNILISGIKARCQAAASSCKAKCDDAMTDMQALIQSSQTPNPDAQAALEGSRKNKRQCRSTAGKFIAAQTATLAEIAMMIQAVTGVLTALSALKNDGSGGDDFQTASVNDDDEEKNECEGEYADLLASCKDPSQIAAKGTRAGLGGTGGASRSGGGSGVSLLASDPGAEKNIGGEKKDKGQAGAGGGFGGGIGGFGGGAGVGSAGAGSSSGSGGQGGEGFNTDIGSGFLSGGGGAGGGGGGGFSGGGSRSGGSKGFGRGSSSVGLAAKAAFQSKLNKFAKSNSRSGRGLASDKLKANGPFEDNWEVLRKAYKSNSPTLFHSN